MQKIDRDKFFESYRNSFGKQNLSQVDGINQLLSFLEGDDKITDLRHAAYMMATVKWETCDTFQPVRENGRGKGLKYGKPDPITGQVFYGRGYTQNTWKYNYEMLTDAWNKTHPDRKIDLVRNPDLLLVPEYSYFAMSYAMRHGAYTGVAMNRFIHGDECDFLHCRKVINGMDKADKIANYAEKLLVILASSVV